MKRIPIKERIALLLLLAVVLTNQLLAGYVMQGILWAFDQLMSVGEYVTLVAAVYVSTLILWHIFDTEKPTIPKTKKNRKDGMKYEVVQ